ncbi:hypothetical protein BH23ACT11_BH23ACT11_12140 [soil metagenome]
MRTLDRDLRPVAAAAEVLSGDVSAGPQMQFCPAVGSNGNGSDGRMVLRTYGDDRAAGRGTDSAVGAVSVPDATGCPTVVIVTERLSRVRALEPEYWRIHIGVEVRTRYRRAPRAGARTLLPGRPGHLAAVVRRRERCDELRRPILFHMRGHARVSTRLKGGIASAELATFGGRTCKNVPGYDLGSLPCDTKRMHQRSPGRDHLIRQEAPNQSKEKP